MGNGSEARPGCQRGRLPEGDVEGDGAAVHASDVEVPPMGDWGRGEDDARWGVGISDVEGRVQSLHGSRSGPPARS